MTQAQLFKPIEPGRQQMLRISIDPTLSLKSFLQEPDIFGFESTVDMEVKQNLFLIAGFGMADVDQTSDLFAYKCNGMFMTLGADLNLTAYRDPQDRHIFYMGMHYGYALVSHEASDINFSNHWVTTELSVPSENRTASWVELTMGIKTEAFNNFFIGWSGESKIRTHLSDGEMLPYYIPGFGKTTKRVSLDFNIWVSYAISFKPKKKKIEEEE